MTTGRCWRSQHGPGLLLIHGEINGRRTIPYVDRTWLGNSLENGRGLILLRSFASVYPTLTTTMADNRLINVMLRAWHRGHCPARSVMHCTGDMEKDHTAWWRYDIDTLSVILALCVGNPPVNGGFPSQRASWTNQSCRWHHSGSH